LYSAVRISKSTNLYSKLTQSNFFAYAEYRPLTRTMKAKVVEKSPNLILEVSRCPWCDAWKESELLPYGRLYCLDVDEAILRGFNPNLKMEVESALSSEAEKCRLVYHDANLTSKLVDVIIS